MSELKYQLMLNKDRSWVPCYRKSEADKVIAEKDKEIVELKKSIEKLLKSKTEQVIDEVIKKCLIYGEGFIPVEHAMRLVSELRHTNYNRCLAMARWCESEMNYWYDSTKLEQRPRFKFYEKWYKRWQELAEKFKEAK